MKRHVEGFSLVELMVAMTVTLIVSGAIYGLLTSGSNAFRREPEVADRQQNIRLAMDLITRDVFNAGTALPTFAQAFTSTDIAGFGACTSGLNGCGDPGSLGPAAAAARADGAGDPSTDSDVLEIVSADETCPVQTVCPPSPDGGNAGTFVTMEPVPGCLPLPGVVLVTDNTSFVVQPAQAAGSPSSCTGASLGSNGSLVLGSGLNPWPAAATINPAVPAVFLWGARIVRYRVAPSGDPLDPSPALWRSATGVFDTAGNLQPEPGVSPTPGANWQLVARGVEDLQVEYLDGTGWKNSPPTVLNNDFTTMVRRVRVTLSARVTAANLQGQTTAQGTGPDAVRGQLVTEVAPRAALTELQIGWSSTSFK